MLGTVIGTATARIAGSAVLGLPSRHILPGIRHQHGGNSIWGIVAIIVLIAAFVLGALWFLRRLRRTQRF